MAVVVGLLSFTPVAVAVDEVTVDQEIARHRKQVAPGFEVVSPGKADALTGSLGGVAPADGSPRS